MEHPQHFTLYGDQANEKSGSTGKDDIFASSSRETVVSPCQNLHPMTDTSLVIQALVGNHIIGPRFCFFCPTSFTKDIALADHVRYEHAKEIRKLSRNRLDILCFHSCPFCPARFYAKTLLPQHLIQDHCDLFSQLFRKSSAEEYVKCPFCEYKILAAFENLLSHHVDECHIAELEEYLTANHSVNIKSDTFLQSFCLEKLPETPGLSEKFAQLTTNPKNINNEKGRGTRRGLFTTDVNKPRSALKAIAENTPKTTSCWGSSNKNTHPKKTVAQVHFATSTPKSHVTQRGPRLAGDFRCANCKVYFSTNNDLVLHVKQHHNAVKALLNPLYGCGECHAAFYKNGFVKRHRKFHHTYMENSCS